MEEQIITLRCKHEDCNTVFRVRLPKKVGLYKVKCPHGHDNVIRVAAKAQEIKLADSNAQANAANAQTAAQANAQAAAQANAQAAAQANAQAAAQANAQANAKSNGGEAAHKPTDPLTTGLHGQSNGAGQLTMVRLHGFFGSLANKTYKLHIGSNTIGRYDPQLPCDIEIRGDAGVSRRSVVIDVLPSSQGYTFKLTVLRATNPVLHNDRALVAGESIYLGYGDRIKLGNTLFNFEKAK